MELARQRAPRHSRGLPRTARHGLLSGPHALAARVRLVGILALTLVSLLVFGTLLVAVSLGRLEVEAPVLAAMVGLWLCTLAYLVARIGTERHALRSAKASTKPALVGDSASAPHVTVLVPSYCEEPRVIAMTLLSAAVAPYASRDIVLLIDDPPADERTVARSLAAAEGVRALIAPQRQELEAAIAAWRERRDRDRFDPHAERQRLLAVLYALAQWYERLARSGFGEDDAGSGHIDAFFAEEVLNPLARQVRSEAGTVLRLTDAAQIDRVYDRLAEHLCAEISTFQRKRFANLSQAPNKAMNLNAYIGLMGERFLIRSRDRQVYLRPAPGWRRDLEVRLPEFVLTLDADSVIRPDYLRELVPILLANPAIAVAQTPYLSFPGAGSRVEQVAGATTDVQFLAHQGSTPFGASFWVGANALIRVSALKDIRRTQVEDGRRVPVFVQDRTVIEDTGSTVDLLSLGWRVHNHFAPLAYSATPADFGALSIQRKRWSNGGLVILPSLLRAVLIAPHGSIRPAGLLLQLHYLTSPAIGNLSILFLMLWTGPNDMVLAVMLLAALPYFTLYTIDLTRLGYRAADILRVMSMNLVLMPVALAGVLESLVQMCTGRKASFVRTPKVGNRTRVPVVYILFHTALLSMICFGLVRAAWSGDTVSVLALAANLGLLSYGLLAYVGLRHLASDLLAALPRLAPRRDSDLVTRMGSQQPLDKSRPSRPLHQAATARAA